ncbi:MAG: hypothetical protein K2Q22_15260 [Cytophagales bacterium]|nr:hypothetical protein [Cytophagales bacterium]
MTINESIPLTSRRRHYQYLILTQSLMIVMVMVVFELISGGTNAGSPPVLLPVFGLIAVLISFQMWRMITQFTSNVYIVYSTLVFVFSRFLVAMVLFSPIGKIFSPLQTQIINSFSLALALVGMSVMLFYMINDIFNEEHEISYRLWGAGCIYIMIGSFFGNIFYLIEVFKPGSLGILDQSIIEKLIHSITHSMYVLAGIDTRYEHLSILVRNVSVVESITVNLYLVLLVGRMLSK